ncbi:uncharacterized protein MYCFIDRAFT_172228 [Pseudocercospora fijiensis CIRAD86]|uniref:Uncharacterized protein n=1 Tax=Pseudocercospora fijiensis (strain CIRAD86) TaxID=383855 RepID=M3BB89_PSEFD|nr:uncharacterized protein MYCFIDRAFT_172228 [Pseudocercospora fijiensis CIRAD86]EME86483.1 hypothetical protein MYCFIDRAFT_172228 [Pseudocercospora fijiensis CIRAD86]
MQYYVSNQLRSGTQYPEIGRELFFYLAKNHIYGRHTTLYQSLSVVVADLCNTSIAYNNAVLSGLDEPHWALRIVSVHKHTGPSSPCFFTMAAIAKGTEVVVLRLVSEGKCDDWNLDVATTGILTRDIQDKELQDCQMDYFKSSTPKRMRLSYCACPSVNDIYSFHQPDLDAIAANEQLTFSILPRVRSWQAHNDDRDHRQRTGRCLTMGIMAWITKLLGIRSTTSFSRFSDAPRNMIATSSTPKEIALFRYTTIQNAWWLALLGTGAHLVKRNFPASKQASHPARLLQPCVTIRLLPLAHRPQSERLLHTRGMDGRLTRNSHSELKCMCPPLSAKLCHMYKDHPLFH